MYLNNIEKFRDFINLIIGVEIFYLILIFKIIDKLFIYILVIFYIFIYGFYFLKFLEYFK